MNKYQTLLFVLISIIFNVSIADEYKVKSDAYVRASNDEIPVILENKEGCFVVAHAKFEKLGLIKIESSKAHCINNGTKEISDLKVYGLVVTQTINNTNTGEFVNALSKGSKIELSKLP